MKKDIDIINKLIEDTDKNRLHWYDDDKCIYCILRNNSREDTIVDVLFRLKEEMSGADPFSIAYEFDEYYMEEFNYIVLEISMRKNKNKEIKCNRISSNQLILLDLMNKASKVCKKITPKK